MRNGRYHRAWVWCIIHVDPQRIGYMIVLKETSFVIVRLNKTDRKVYI